MYNFPNFTIDVIIPCYNAHKTLTRALSSVAMQTLIDRITVTLVDDASPDGGYEDIIKPFENIMPINIVTLETNGGPGVARQAGLDNTDGDFICFIDSDDTLSTAYALHQMARAMIEHNMDVVGGQFIEEVENGNFVTHPKNMIWVFGKLYRRSFIERHLIRFNETRCNEDTGFNAVVNSLTQNIEHIPQTVYMWHFAENTITRSNKGEYTWAHGHRGYIENMIWACQEMRKRNINKELIRRHIVTVLCRLYFMHEEVIAKAPSEAAGSWEWIVRFYAECVRPIEEDMFAAYIYEAYVEEQKNTKLDCMPMGNFRGFLKDLREEAEPKRAAKKLKKGA
jgi:glycosyltransferase involved in cell wall biosynthesis